MIRKRISIIDIFILLLFSFLTACNSEPELLLNTSVDNKSDNSKQDYAFYTEPNKLINPVDELYDQAHSTQNAVDWDGSYIGTLPCDNCLGIKTVLTLNKAGYYRLEETYLDKKEFVYYSEGRFNWDISGSRISFRGDDKRVWFIGESSAWLVNNEGVIADTYILEKQHE